LWKNTVSATTSELAEVPRDVYNPLSSANKELPGFFTKEIHGQHRIPIRGSAEVVVRVSRALVPKDDTAET
jgi:hypothetical protein